MTKNVLILSPYDGMSHKYWRESLADYLEATGNMTVSALTMHARFFSWRQRGNSLGFALHPALDKPDVELLIVTSMTDLSALRGLNRAVSDLPVIVYFHENQFAYPDTHTEGLVERQLTSIYTALSANAVVFNSAYNRSTFLAGAGDLLARMPDQVPEGVVSSVENKSVVVPVALPERSAKDNRQELTPGPNDKLRIVWNHRREHDKGPALLLDIVKKLLGTNLDFELTFLGQQFRRSPGEFGKVEEILTQAGRLSASGFIQDRESYLSCLASHDIVLSTADQEFQGLAVQEAMLQGCTPVVPDRLAYTEYVPASLRYESADEAVKLISSRPAQSVDLDRYSWRQVGPPWLDLVSGTLRSGGNNHP